MNDNDTPTRDERAVPLSPADLAFLDALDPADFATYCDADALAGAPWVARLLDGRDEVEAPC